jgi:hypothetical protein
MLRHKTCNAGRPLYDAEFIRTNAAYDLGGPSNYPQGTD